MEIDKKIVSFIEKHHVMTLATLSEAGVPHTANLFYVYNKERGEFIFTSSLKTAHGADMQRSSSVGANIVLETSNVGQIEGLQIEGEASLVTQENSAEAKRLYIKKYPYAVIAPLELWVLRVDFFKLTDNKLGFGKKILWTTRSQM